MTREDLFIGAHKVGKTIGRILSVPVAIVSAPIIIPYCVTSTIYEMHLEDKLHLDGNEQIIDLKVARKLHERKCKEA